MDSCHIFNFLFGARKTTSELSKHFQSSFNEATNDLRVSRRNKSSRAGQDLPHHDRGRSLPSSPLKQIQQKFTNLAKSAKKSQIIEQSKHEDCVSAKCGTYRARLVEPHELSSEETQPTAEILRVDNNNNNVLANLRQENFNKALTQEETLAHCCASLSHHASEIVLYEDPTNESDEFVLASAHDYSINLAQSSETNNGGQCARSAILRRFGSQENEGTNHFDLSNAGLKRQEFTEVYKDKKTAKSDKVKNLVQSFELSTTNQTSHNQSCESSSSETPRTPIKLKWPPDQLNHAKQDKCREKPITIVKPLPPKTPPKSNKVKYINLQLKLSKPTKIGQLFQDREFLVKLFRNLEPIERCVAAQVCRSWRDLLYSDQAYWKNLISVIDCTQLRREHLLECIINTLQSAKLKHNNQLLVHHHSGHQHNSSSNGYYQSNKQILIDPNCTSSHTQISAPTQRGGQMIFELDTTEFDQDEIWKIQELCQKFTRGSNNYASRSLIHEQHHNQANGLNQHQHEHQQQQAITTKSSSIPSQISSTLSSASISSLLSPLSESSRVDSIKERLYTALDDRGFEAICLYGASDDDIEDIVNKTPSGTHRRIVVGRLDNCCITDRGLELFISTFDKIVELELCGCNEITNSVEFKILQNLERLIITDCINIADGLASRLVQIFHQLSELTLQAYHLTDVFLEYISLNSDTSGLKVLELPNCKEITNHSMLTIAKHFHGIERLSISGSTKISDDGIEILGEQAKNLRSLDLSWCTKITDISLECIACDFSLNLREIILDRNVNITDMGLGYLATMSNLTLVYIRWCPRITDLGVESILTIKTLKQLSLAGLHQVTARSLLCLIERISLEEVELTNCSAVNNELLEFLASKMPECNIVY